MVEYAVQVNGDDVARVNGRQICHALLNTTCAVLQPPRGEVPTT
eukprot:CAMPEP_0172928512 /NCGR_PEP_ID=MMETSP1075-20121228/218015_1 /TAXON_ID=2916 /ORGANISM="Ceratium fusus, Strain PA161109" /LENGTH=43 /DNA_ID= /DNA_START= /DNA_END= /DNA_ORIENTATION=